MTVRGRSWTKTPQDEKMLISSKTRVECTAETLLPRRRARVGGLCGFRSPAEASRREPQNRTLRLRAGSLQEWQAQKKDGFRQRKKPQAAKQDKAAGSCAPRSGHICPRCGQFRVFTGAFQKQRKTALGRCGMKKARRFKGNRGVPTKNTR